MNTHYISCNGCMLYIILFILILFFFKMLWLIIFVVLLLLLGRMLTQRWLLKETKPKEYEPKEGEVYKQCNYCGAKAPRNAQVCPKCNRPLS